MAAAPASLAVFTTWASACVSGTVTSQANGLPLDQRRMVVPSWRFLSCRIRPTGSLTAGNCARFMARQMMSLLLLVPNFTIIPVKLAPLWCYAITNCTFRLYIPQINTDLCWSVARLINLYYCLVFYYSSLQRRTDTGDVTWTHEHISTQTVTIALSVVKGYSDQSYRLGNAKPPVGCCWSYLRQCIR